MSKSVNTILFLLAAILAVAGCSKKDAEPAPHGDSAAAPAAQAPESAPASAPPAALSEAASAAVPPPTGATTGAAAPASPTPTGEAPPQAATTAPPKPIDAARIVQGLCSACHQAGMNGAPKFGSKVAWAPRIAQGREKLYENAIKGLRGMPPRGGDLKLSDDEVKAAVDYMVKAAGGYGG